jgi:hypothetical protein
MVMIRVHALRISVMFMLRVSVARSEIEKNKEIMWTCDYKPMQLHGRDDQHRPDFGHVHGIPRREHTSAIKQRPHGHILLLGGGGGYFCGE